jgi:hypothetical protein
MSKKNAYGVPETFKKIIQKFKFESERRRHIQLDDTLDHYIWNGLDIVQYKVILGDCEQLANIALKKEYSLVIVDILHGYNIQNIGYDIKPCIYQAFNRSSYGIYGSYNFTILEISSISFRHTTRISTIKASKGKKIQGCCKILKVYV